MDIKQILLDNGIDAEVAEKASKSIKTNIGKEFVSKEQYGKKAGSIAEYEEKIKDLEAEKTELEAKAQQATKYKSDYDNLVTEHNNFKNEIETKELNATKKSKLVENLKSEGFNEKIIPLLTKEFDLSKLEIEEDNIKGWEELSKDVKEGYKDFITTTSQEGTPPAKPPVGNPTSFTKESISNMSTEEINANWGEISKALNNI